MLYYLYEIRNNINGKIYIGVHKSNDIDDGYMGSGALIQLAIKKYGIENFTKTILEYFDDSKSMFLKEYEIVDIEFVSRRDTYNLAIGGCGGSMLQNRRSFSGKHSDQSRKKISDSSKGRIVADAAKINMSRHHWVKLDPVAQKEHSIYAARKSVESRKMNNNISYNKVSCSLLERNKENRDCGIPHHNSGIPKKKIECPICNKMVAINTANRWHFDNCKMRT
jgi:hypothetical protein